MSLHKPLILSVYIPSLITALVNTAILILLPLYMLHLGYSVATASFIVALRGLGLLCFDVPAGLIANRIGDKATLLLGTIILVSSSGLLAISQSLGAIALATMFLGASTSLVTIGRLSYITDSTTINERGRVIAAWASMFRVGTLLGPLLFSMLAQYTSYQFVFGAMTALMLTALILIAVHVNNIVAHHRKKAPISGMVKIARDYRQIFLTAGTAGMIMMMLRAARYLLFPIVGHSIGLSVANIGLLVSLSAVVDILMSYPAGIVMDRMGRKWTAVPGIFVMSISMLLLPFMESATGMLIFAIVSGVGNGITSGVLLTIAADLAPDAARNHFMGLWRMQLDVGHFVAPILVGAVASAVTISVATLTFAGIGFFGTAILAFFVRETLNKEN